jgi:hypothetical protein
VPMWNKIFYFWNKLYSELEQISCDQGLRSGGDGVAIDGAGCHG